MSEITPGGKGSMVGGRLSVMMFLQFFVWGSWYVSMTGFINVADMSGVTAWAYTVGPIAAILSPFFLGLIADRYFPSERVLGVLHLLGGGVLCLAPSVASRFDPETTKAFLHPFILVLLVHMLCYMPTLGLTSSLAFHNLKNREKGFPLVRVFGTIGWIVGNIAVTMLPEGDKSASQFYLAGGAGVLLGLFSFTLPHTPPPMRGQKASVRQIMGLDALVLLKDRSYAVFILCSFLLCIPLAGYYNEARNFVEATGFTNPTFTMSFGQMAEIFFMLVMPLFFLRLGVKWMLMAGMLAWVARYGLFAGAADAQVKWMVLAGVLMHGICYDFFFVTGMVYVDKATPTRVRGQAQGMLVLVTQGLGMLIGAQVFGRLVKANTTTIEGVAVRDWQGIWLIPCVAAGVIAVLFFVLFRENKSGVVAATLPDSLTADPAVKMEG